MTNDSVVQWAQLLTGRFTDVHPAFHTMAMWLLTRIWQSPATVAIGQLLSLSAVGGWGFTLARRLGAPRLLVCAACLIFALSPINGVWVVTLWKDIAYGISVLALTLLVVQIVATDGLWLQRRRSWLLLGAVAALVALFRHNGAAAAFGTPIVLALFLRTVRRQLFWALLTAVLLWAGVKGPIYRLVGVETLASEAGQRLALSGIVNQVAAHVAADTPLTTAERQYLDTILPLDSQWEYCCEYDRTIRSSQLNWWPITQQKTVFLRIWLSLWFRNPQVSLRHILCHSWLLWRPLQPQEHYTFNSGAYLDERGLPWYIHPRDNSLDLRMESKLPGLAVRLTKVILASQEGRWTIWQPATYLYFLLVTVIAAAVRKRRCAVLLIAVPVVLHTFFLVFTITTPDSRFQYPVYLVSLVLWPALFSSSLSTTQRDPLHG